MEKPIKPAKLRTAEKVAAFLEYLVTYGGNISAACEAAGLARSMVYEMERNSDEFKTAFRAAQRHGLEALEDEARRRAFSGTEKPVFYQGEVCGTVKDYSDSLLVFLLKGGMPGKYRERHELSGNGGGPLTIRVVSFAETENSQ